MTKSNKPNASMNQTMKGGRFMSGIMDKMGKIISDVKEKTGDLKEKAEDVLETAKEKAEVLKDKAEDALEEAKEKAETLKDKVEDVFEKEEKPKTEETGSQPETKEK
jgi:small subunit ribosomal protein S3